MDRQLDILTMCNHASRFSPNITTFVKQIFIVFRWHMFMETIALDYVRFSVKDYVFFNISKAIDWTV